MSAANPTRSRRRKWLQAGIGIAIFAVFVSAGWYLTSPQFHEYVRGRVLGKLTQISGGRVEVGAVRWNLSRLHFEIDDLTIHGREASTEMPFAHVDRLVANLRVLSLFGGRLGLRYLGLQHPTFHLIVYPDGSTNQPVPSGPQGSVVSDIDEMVDLAARRFVVRDGVLLVNDRPIPLDFAAQDVSAQMSYAALHGRYDGRLSFARMQTKYGSFLPVDSAVTIAFSLWAKRLQVKSLQWTAGRSRVDASGTLEDFRAPHGDVRYVASLDLAQVGAVVGTPEIQSGLLDAEGQGTYTAQDFSVAGKLSARDVGWRDDLVRLNGLRVRSEYSLTNDALNLTGVEGTLFGGDVGGEAHVVHWSNVRTREGAKATHAAMSAPQQGSIHLRIARVGVGGILQAVSSRALPFDRMELVGATSGTIDATWSGAPQDAIANIAVEVMPPAQAAPRQMPLTAALRAVYRASSGIIEVSRFNASTPAMRLSADGTVGSNTAHLNVALSSNEIAAVEPLLAVFRPNAQWPAGVQGRGSFTGTIRGKLRSPTMVGQLEIDGFDGQWKPSTLPFGGLDSVTQAQPVRVQWDVLRADVSYSPSQFSAQNGLVRKGDAQARFDVSAALRKGEFLDTNPFKATVHVQHADFAALEALLGLTYPVRGTLDGSVKAFGTESDPQGNGQFTLTNGDAYGEPFQSLRADLRFADHEAEFDNAALAHNGARVTGSAAYNLVTHAIRFDLHGTNFDLAKVKDLQSRRFTVGGQLGFHAQGSGTTEAPVIDAALQLRDLVLNRERVGDFDANAFTRGPDLHVTGHSKFVRSQLAVDGQVRLRDQWPANISLRFTDLDFDPFLTAYLPGHLTGHSSMDGTVDLRGPLKQPRQLNIIGDIPDLYVSVENVVLRNTGPIRFRMADGIVDVQQLRIAGEATDFSATGTVALTGSKEMNIRADGGVNLRLLQTFDPDLLSSGTTTIAVQVEGTVATPSVGGAVDIRNGAISYIDLPNGLSNVNGRLVFNQNRLQVQSLTAQTGGGTLILGGFVSYARGLYFDLTATSRDIRLRYPQGISSTANAQLHYQGTTSNSLLSGDVTVTRFAINQEFDFASYLARAKQAPVTPQPGSPLNNLRLDVHIVSTPELQVESSLGRLSGEVDLHLRGTAIRPVLLGRVDITDGEIYFNGTKYHIDRGDLVFSNPVRIEPVVDVEATARVRDYDITLGFHGPLDHMATTYRSDPPLPPGDIIALLAMGRTQEEAYQYSTGYQPTFSESASNAILGEALNQMTTNRAQKLFGVGRIKIDPQVGGPENNPNARLTIEQQVSDKVTLTYITNLAQTQQQIIQAEYYITRNVSIIAVRDENGVVGMDIRVRRRKK